MNAFFGFVALYAGCPAILELMSAITELEKEIFALSPAERERLAMVAWESLVSDPKASSNREIDPEGIQLAAQRDAEFESGKVQGTR
jgi:hypothetical protein